MVIPDEYLSYVNKKDDGIKAVDESKSTRPSRDASGLQHYAMKDVLKRIIAARTIASRENQLYEVSFTFLSIYFPK